MGTPKIDIGLSIEFSSLNDLLECNAVRYANRTAFHDIRNGKQLTYEQLALQTAKMGNLLDTYDVGAGDRVAFITRNNVDFFPLLFACAKRLAAIVPLSLDWLPSEREAVLKDACVKLVIEESQSCRKIDAETINEETPTSANSAPAIIIYTSGTTGQSKGVVLTQGNLTTMGRSISQFYEIGNDDTLLSLLPYYHINAPVVTGIMPLTVGARICFGDLFGFTNAKSIWKTAANCGITILSLTPSIMAALQRIFPNGHNLDLPKLRMALVGTAKLDAVFWKTFEEQFKFPCFQGYGLTETTTWATMTPTGNAKRFDSAGVPVDCEIKINEDVEIGSDSKPGTGEILIRGDLVMKGYHGRKKLTKQALKDGWFHSGDLGFIDSDGQLVVTGRLKNIIKRNGLLILPDEIESAMLSLGGVSEAKVIGVPDDLSGERVLAGYVGTETAQRVREKLGEILSHSRRPDEIIKLGRIPRTPIGKTDQKKLIAVLTGVMRDNVVKCFDRYEYRRARSSTMDEVVATVQRCLISGSQLRFVGFWGVGPRSEMTNVDYVAIERLVRLQQTIDRLVGEPFSKMQLVLADVHGRTNKVPESVISSYLGAIENHAREKGIDVCLLSEIWKEAGLDHAEVLRKATDPEALREWETFPLREDFKQQARHRAAPDENLDIVAARYFFVCLAEKTAVSEAFRGSIFFTFSDPKLQPILPLLPTLFWHSIKRGVSERPWFL